VGKDGHEVVSVSRLVKETYPEGTPPAAWSSRKPKRRTRHLQRRVLKTTPGNAASERGADVIVAIDFGKYKGVACIYRGAEDLHFQSLPANREELVRLFARPVAVGPAAATW
jgi:hypothetical protein